VHLHILSHTPPDIPLDMQDAECDDESNVLRQIASLYADDRAASQPEDGVAISVAEPACAFLTLPVDAVPLTNFCCPICRRDLRARFSLFTCNFSLLHSHLLELTIRMQPWRLSCTCLANTGLKTCDHAA